MTERDYGIWRFSSSFSVLGLVEEKLIPFLLGYGVFERYGFLKENLEDGSLHSGRDFSRNDRYKPTFIETNDLAFTGFCIPPRYCRRRKRRKIVKTRNVNYRNG